MKMEYLMTSPLISQHGLSRLTEAKRLLQDKEGMEKISLAKEKLDALDDKEDAPIEELKK